MYRLTAEQATKRLRGRIVSELKSLNNYLPPTMWLRRSEIERIADDLLHTVRETPKRRNAPLLKKAACAVSRTVLHPVRKLFLSGVAVSDMAQWDGKVLDDVNNIKGNPHLVPEVLAKRELASFGAATADENREIRIG